ncbi:10143_t:CDS:2, partial [Entrophospora sp. SA101]
LSRICVSSAKELGLSTEFDEVEEDLGSGSESDEGCEGDRIPMLPRIASFSSVSSEEFSIPVESVYRVDRSILYSSKLVMERRKLELKECNPEEVTQMILYKKKFPNNGSNRTPAAIVLYECLTQICDTYKLTIEINFRAQTKYNSEDKSHEKKLLELQGRLTEQWTKIGFQGKDPATDFRGMGMLGLDDLVYYAKNYRESSHYALESSYHTVSWYSFAIVGLNITSFALQTLRTRQLQYFLFKYGIEKNVYHEFYCYLFHSFNEYWTTYDQSVITTMDFEWMFAQFKINIRKELMERRITVLDETKNIFTQSKKIK